MPDRTLSGPLFPVFPDLARGPFKFFLTPTLKMSVSFCHYITENNRWAVREGPEASSVLPSMQSGWQRKTQRAAPWLERSQELWQDGDRGGAGTVVGQGPWWDIPAALWKVGEENLQSLCFSDSLTFFFSLSRPPKKTF